MLDIDTIFDSLTMRCPRLGGTVNFKYCLKVNDQLPCPRSLICWEAPFPVERYMKKVLSDEEWRIVFEQPSKSRVDVLINAADKARQPCGEE